jgi:hypothetical protein
MPCTRRRQLLGSLLLAALLSTRPALAQESPPPDPSKGDSFDGREHRPTVTQGFLFVPRLVLWLPRMIYRVGFYPLGNSIRWSEEHAVMPRVAMALSSPDGAIGVRPMFDFVTGYRFVFGLRFFDHKLLGPGTDFSLSLAGNLIGIVLASASVRPTHINRPIEYTASVGYYQRDDFLFTGIGMAAAQSHPGARFLGKALEQANVVSFVLGKHWRLSTNGVFGYQRFGNGIPYGNDQPILQVYCIRLVDGRCRPPPTVDPVQVPGFYTGTQFLRAGIGLHVDTRDVPFRPTSGAAFDAYVDYSHGLGASDPSTYFRTHFALTAVLDLWARSRVLVLRAATNALWPAGNEFVPFFELPVLGGPDGLRGARWGKYRDFTNVLFTAEYRWPIWMWMDAALFTDYGGAFGKNYNGFAIDRFVPDIGVGLRLRTSGQFYLRVQAAYGWGEGWNFSIAGTMDPT